MNYIYIAIFAFIGVVTRYSVSLLFGSSHAQISTMVINVIGSFLIVVVSELFTQIKYVPNELVTGISIGFLGSFTTFSMYSYESLEYILNQQYISFLVYSLGSIFCSLFGAWLAYVICRQTKKLKGEMQQ
ncbi:fluoride efflux transporter CrcB [Helicobacter pylori]